LPTSRYLSHPLLCSLFFFFNTPSTSAFYPLSLHDALPICIWAPCSHRRCSASPSRRCGCSRSARSPKRGTSSRSRRTPCLRRARSEEHPSELQSLAYLVCRLLLEKKKKNNREQPNTNRCTH